MAVSYELAVFGKLFDQRVVNTFHYQRVVPAGGVDPDGDQKALGYGFQLNFLPKLAALSASQLSWNFLRVTVVPKGVNPPAFVEQLFTQPGLATGTCTNPTVSLVVTKRTPNAGRSYRGRNYVGGLPAEELAEGGVGVTAPYLTALIAFVEAVPQLMSGATGGGDALGTYQPIAWSRKLSLGTFLTSATSDRVQRTQRRRELGIGV